MKEIKEMWADYYDKGYARHGNIEGMRNLVVFTERCYSPFVTYTETNSDIYVMYPIEDTITVYAEPSGMGRGHVLIPKNSPNYEATCAFLNELSADEELLKAVTWDNKGYEFMRLSPMNDVLNGFTLYNHGTLEENKAETERRMAQYELSEIIPEFVFDPTPVAEQVTEIKAILDALKERDSWTMETIFPEYWEYSMEEWSAYWDECMESLIQDMYDAGMQDVIDEVNRQIQAYQAEN